MRSGANVPSAVNTMNAISDSDYRDQPSAVIVKTRSPKTESSLASKMAPSAS